MEKEHKLSQYQDNTTLFLSVYELGIRGPALTAVWSKAPPLIARCVSPLPGFEYRPGHVG